MPETDATAAQAPAKGHPKGLYVLFFAEMWERFSFYGMRALLNLYLVKRLGFTKEAAYGVYGAYGTLVYAFPVIGGALADKLLGYRVAVVIGGTLMAIGHLVMTIESLPFLFLALALIAMGNGFFKPNISSIVGKLYPDGDPRRDSGFTIFYMGINIGAFFSQNICGYVGERFGWHYGFGLATFGMTLGLIVFVRGRNLLEGHGLPPDRDRLLRPRVAGLNNLALVLLAVLLLLPVVALGLYKNQYVGYVLYAAGILVLAYLLVMAFSSERIWRDRMFLLLVLMVFHMLFWSFFEQAGSSLTLFADEHLNRNILGFEVKASQIGSLNPLYIMILAIPFSILWTKLDRVRLNPSIPMKFSLGLLQVGLGFGALILGTRLAGDAKTGFGWMALTYLLHTTGELCLSPVGLSAVTKLAMPKVVGVVMGAWFLTIAFAHNVAAIIAKLTAGGHGASGLVAYVTTYKDILYGAVIAAVVLAILARPLTKLAHGVE